MALIVKAERPCSASHPGRKPGDWQGYSLDHADYLAAAALRFGVPVECLEVVRTGGGRLVRPRDEVSAPNV